MADALPAACAVLHLKASLHAEHLNVASQSLYQITCMPGPPHVLYSDGLERARVSACTKPSSGPGQQPF